MLDAADIQLLLASVLSVLRWISLALVLLNYRAFPLVWHCALRLHGSSDHWN